jgi:putative transposase
MKANPSRHVRLIRLWTRTFGPSPAEACHFAADAARRLGSTNKVKVQQVAYAEMRKLFGLSANLAIRAIARACAALKVPAKMHSKFAPTSIDYRK